MLAQLVEEETDMGPRSVAAARAPLSRLCLATRAVTPVTDMLRFVVGPDGRIVPDLARKLPGRGAWVSATRAALETALKKKAFGRAFKGKGTAGPELLDLIDTLLDKDARSALALANKAGQVVTGTMKVETALASGRVAVLLHAADARPDGVRKLDGLARQLVHQAEIATGSPFAPPAIVDCFPGVDLDLVLGRSNVVHAALLAHPTTAGFLARCRKLARWRTGVSADAENGAGPSSGGHTPDGLTKMGRVPADQGQGDPGPAGGDQACRDRGGEDARGSDDRDQECSRARGRMQGTDTE